MAEYREMRQTNTSQVVKQCQREYALAPGLHTLWE